jgi:membrane-associated phospholipid phosphatase
MSLSSVSQAADRLDSRVDSWYGPARRNAFLNSIMVAASTLGDWSLIWHLTGATRGLLTREFREIFLLSILLGVESLIVNQGIKRLFRRQRPTEHGAEGLTVRKPRTSSFPSGHASAAGFAVVMLSAMTGGWWMLLWIFIATTVATSRFHVRIHHATDVVAGAFVGAALATALLPLL